MCPRECWGGGLCVDECATVRASVTEVYVCVCVGGGVSLGVGVGLFVDLSVFQSPSPCAACVMGLLGSEFPPRLSQGVHLCNLVSCSASGCVST